MVRSRDRCLLLRFGEGRARAHTCEQGGHVTRVGVSDRHCGCALSLARNVASIRVPQLCLNIVQFTPAGWRAPEARAGLKLNPSRSPRGHGVEKCSVGTRSRHTCDAWAFSAALSAQSGQPVALRNWNARLVRPRGRTMIFVAKLVPVVAGAAASLPRLRLVAPAGGCRVPLRPSCSCAI